MNRRTYLRFVMRPAFVYRTPKDVQFVSGEEFLKIAAKAYAEACQHSIPPRGEPWLQQLSNGNWSLWSGPEDFYNALLRGVKTRLESVAVRRGEMRRFDADTCEPISHPQEVRA